MTPCDTQAFLPRKFCHKKSFLVNLFTPLFRHLCEKNFLHSFIHFFECFFLIFHFKHVLKEISRKVVMEPIFSMNTGFKPQLHLWAPPLLINLTQSYCTNSVMAQTQITSSMTGKVVLTIPQLEWLVVTIFDRNTAGKTSCDYLNQF